MQITDDLITFPIIGPGPEHVDQRIWLPQLIVEAMQTGGLHIEGRTFRRCLMEGPAVVVPVDGCQFDTCNMGDAMGDPRNLLLTPQGPQKVTGAIAFRNCQFIECTFMRVGFTGAPAFLDNMRAMLSGGAQA